MKKIVLVLLALPVVMGLTTEGWAQDTEIRQEVVISIDNYRLAKIRKSDFQILWSKDILLDSGIPDIIYQYQAQSFFYFETDNYTGNIFVVWISLGDGDPLNPPGPYMSLVMKYRGTDGRLLWKRVFNDASIWDVNVDVYGRIFLDIWNTVCSICDTGTCCSTKHMMERLRQDGTTYGSFELPSGSSYQPPPQ